MVEVCKDALMLFVCWARCFCFAHHWASSIASFELRLVALAGCTSIHEIWFGNEWRLESDIVVRAVTFWWFFTQETTDLFHLEIYVVTNIQIRSVIRSIEVWIITGNSPTIGWAIHIAIHNCIVERIRVNIKLWSSWCPEGFHRRIRIYSNVFWWMLC